MVLGPMLTLVATVVVLVVVHFCHVVVRAQDVAARAPVPSSSEAYRVPVPDTVLAQYDRTHDAVVVVTLWLMRLYWVTPFVEPKLTVVAVVVPSGAVAEFPATVGAADTELSRAQGAVIAAPVAMVCDWRTLFWLCPPTNIPALVTQGAFAGSHQPRARVLSQQNPPSDVNVIAPFAGLRARRDIRDRTAVASCAAVAAWSP